MIYQSRFAPGIIRFPALLVLAGLLALAAPAVPAAAHDLQTADGMTLQVDETGRVTGLQVSGDELLTTGTTGGFAVTDLTGLTGENLVQNGGFEGGFTTVSDGVQVPDGWTLLLAQGADGEISLLPHDGDFYEGTRSLRYLTTQDEDPVNILEVETNRFAVVPGAFYHASLACRSDQGYIVLNTWFTHRVYVYLNWYDAGGSLLDTERVLRLGQTFYHWARYSGWSAAPPGAATAALNIHVEGNIPFNDAPITFLIDDVRCFREPDGIRDIPAAGTALGSGGSVELIAGDIGGRGLRLTAHLEALADRIAISGVVTPEPGNEGLDRALDLCFVLPVNTSSGEWFWYDNLHERYAITGTDLYDETVRLEDSSENLRFNAYNLSCIADVDHAVNVGLDPAQVRPFNVSYDAAAGQYVIRFQLGLAPEREHAGFEFFLYTSTGKWGFRGALKRYYAMYPDYGEPRMSGGTPVQPGSRVRSDKIIGTPYETDPEDFGVRYFEASSGANLPYLVDDLGLRCTMYTLPWLVGYKYNEDIPPPPYPEWYAAVYDQSTVFTEVAFVEAEPEDFMLNARDTTGQDLLLSHGTYNFMTDKYEFFGPVNIDPNQPGDGIGDRILETIDAYYEETAINLGGDHYVSGVFMDYTNTGAATLDATRSRFATAGYDLTYDPHSLKPALWTLNAYQEYLGALRTQLETSHPGFDITGSNLLQYGYLFAASSCFDLLGSECSHVSGGRWRCRFMDYYRIIGGSKSYVATTGYKYALPFDEPSGEYYKGMCDLFNVSLLYGIYLDLERFVEMNGRDLEALRPLYASVVPYIDLFLSLGWKPCHFAEQLNEDLEPEEDIFVQVERFGPNPAVQDVLSAYIVVLYNDRSYRVYDMIFPRPAYLGETREFRMLVDVGQIGLEEPVTVEELSATMHDMAPVVDPDITLVNNMDGTCLITGTVAWRDALVLKITEFEPDTTPPAPPQGLSAVALPGT